MKNIISIVAILIFTTTVCFAQKRGGSKSSGSSSSSSHSHSTETNLQESGEYSARDYNPGYEAYSKGNEEFTRKTNGKIPFEQTNDKSESKIYIDIFGIEIFAVSNYTEENNSSSQTAKEGQKIDIKQIVDKASGSNEEYHEREVIINQKIFSKYSVENVDKLVNAKVLTPEGKIYSVKEFDTSQEKEKIIGAEIFPNCFIDVRKQFNNFHQYLTTKKVEADEIIISSLVTNSETNNTLKEQLPNNHSILTCKNETEFRAELSKLKHKTLFIVGHIENGNFVNKSASGEKIFELEVEKLLKISKDLDVNIIPFGCFSSQYSPSGTTSEINSLKTVEVLTNALKTVRHQYGKNKLSNLLDEIGKSSETKLLIDEKNFKNQKYGTYKKVQVLKKEGSKWVIVAIMYLVNFPDDDDEYEEDTTWYWIKQKSPYFSIGTFLFWFFMPSKPSNKFLKVVTYTVSLSFWFFLVVLILHLIGSVQ